MGCMASFEDMTLNILSVQSYGLSGQKVRAYY